jgi:hypothetical protein
MCVIFYWGCRFDSFLLLLVSVPYYIQTLSAPSPCSPCHLSLLACRSLCIIVRALDICVRPPFSAFCTHFTLRRRSKRFRRFKRWVWSPCGTHGALTRPTGRQRSPSCGTHFFFAMYLNSTIPPNVIQLSTSSTTTTVPHNHNLLLNLRHGRNPA